MLVVETVVRIRRERAGGKSIRAIARDLRLSRKAVRKAIDAPEGAFTYHRMVQPLPRIGPFQERLDTLLMENEGLPRRDRLRMTRIHDLLLREGFEGSYDAVRRYAARWKAALRKDAGANIVGDVPAFIPLLFQPCEAYQFDWSHEDVEIDGKAGHPPLAQRIRISDLGIKHHRVDILGDNENPHVSFMLYFQYVRENKWCPGAGQ